MRKLRLRNIHSPRVPEQRSGGVRSQPQAAGPQWTGPSSAQLLAGHVTLNLLPHSVSPFPFTSERGLLEESLNSDATKVFFSENPCV